jgi:phage baseplate assembly protein W
MATIHIDNLIKPRLKNSSTTKLDKEEQKLSYTYTDLSLDLKTAKSIGDGLNVVDSKDIVVSHDEKAVQNSLYNIFSTKKGQKILNPEFGASLDMFLFEKVNSFIGQSIGDTILSTIKKYEPRIIVRGINVYPRPDQNEYYIQLFYQNAGKVSEIKMRMNNENIIFV